LLDISLNRGCHFFSSISPNKFWARIELDRTILKILVFSNKEIDEWLPEIYDVIVEKLKTIRKVVKTE
jgi:dephospho-CoA kinase